MPVIDTRPEPFPDTVATGVWPRRDQVRHPRRRPALIASAVGGRAGLEFGFQMGALFLIEPAGPPAAPLEAGAATPPAFQARCQRPADIGETRNRRATSA